MDLAEWGEISKSSNQVIIEGGLNKADRNSGKGPDVRHIFMIEPEGLADRSMVQGNGKRRRWSPGS